jgi:hypothetical protein
VECWVVLGENGVNFGWKNGGKFGGVVKIVLGVVWSGNSVDLGMKLGN